MGYADSVLQTLRYWFIATSAIPVVYCLIAAGYNIWIRYLRKTKRDLKDMNIEELKDIARKKKDAIAKHKKAKEEAIALAKQNKEQLALAGQLHRVGTISRFGKSMSFGAGLK